MSKKLGCNGNFFHTIYYVACSTLWNIFIAKYLMSSYFLWTHEALLHQGGKKPYWTWIVHFAKLYARKKVRRKMSIFLSIGERYTFNKKAVPLLQDWKFEYVGNSYRLFDCCRNFNYFLGLSRIKISHWTIVQSVSREKCKNWF